MTKVFFKYLTRKTNLMVILMALICVGSVSCGGGDDPDPGPGPDPQKPLTISPTEINLASNAGAQASFTISCNGKWTANCTASWLTLSVESGTDTGAIIVTASTENPENSERMHPFLYRDRSDGGMRTHHGHLCQNGSTALSWGVQAPGDI